MRNATLRKCDDLAARNQSTVNEQIDGTIYVTIEFDDRTCAELQYLGH